MELGVFPLRAAIPLLLYPSCTTGFWKMHQVSLMIMYSSFCFQHCVHVLRHQQVILKRDSKLLTLVGDSISEEWVSSRAVISYIRQPPVHNTQWGHDALLQPVYIILQPHSINMVQWFECPLPLYSTCCPIPTPGHRKPLAGSNTIRTAYQCQDVTHRALLVSADSRDGWMIHIAIQMYSYLNTELSFTMRTCYEPWAP